MKIRFTTSLVTVFLLSALSVACSSSKTDQAQSPAGTAGKPSIGPYPDGPYGNEVGQTLTNLQLQGYLNEEADAISNTKPFLDSYSLEDLRATGANYALVHVSEFF
jgi:hypothetical protein